MTETKERARFRLTPGRERHAHDGADAADGGAFWVLAVQLACLVIPAGLNLAAAAYGLANAAPGALSSSEALRLRLVIAVLHGLIAGVGAGLLIWLRRRAPQPGS